MKIACVTSIKAVGCTFVDWSLHFLSNQSNSYNAEEKSVVPLTNMPLTSINAHGHRKNHPSGLLHTIQCIQSFRNQTQTDFCSMYPWPLEVPQAMEDLGIVANQLPDRTVWKEIEQYMANDYQALLNYCFTNEVNTVYIDPDPTLNLYFMAVRSLDRLLLTRSPARDESEVLDTFQTTFFHHSINHWSSQGLTNIWDVRERQALSMKPFDRPEDRFQLKLYHPHLWINSAELWNHGEDTIRRIMDYFDLPINQDRWNQWLPVHQQWHTKQQQNLKFAYQFNHIIDAIVNGYYYKLEKLSFLQEVVIQHALIYWHNLNLKTWQLTQFPSNTQDLHKLLEPNIHPI